RDRTRRTIWTTRRSSHPPGSAFARTLGRLGRHGAGVPVGLGGRADLQVPPARRLRVVALVLSGVDIAAGVAGVDARRQAALLQFRLHLVGIERLDAEGDVADVHALARRGAGPIERPDDEIAD